MIRRTAINNSTNREKSVAKRGRKKRYARKALSTFATSRKIVVSSGKGEAEKMGARIKDSRFEATERK